MKGSRGVFAGQESEGDGEDRDGYARFAVFCCCAAAVAVVSGCVLVVALRCDDENKKNAQKGGETVENRGRPITARNY